MKNRKEADKILREALLLMKYDTSKTLTENQSSVKRILKEVMTGI